MKKFEIGKRYAFTIYPVTVLARSEHFVTITDPTGDGAPVRKRIQHDVDGNEFLRIEIGPGMSYDVTSWRTTSEED